MICQVNVKIGPINQHTLYSASNAKMYQFMYTVCISLRTQSPNIARTAEWLKSAGILNMEVLGVTQTKEIEKFSDRMRDK